MQLATGGFDIAIKTLLYITPDPCPHCGGNMYAWRQKTKDGKDRCEPTCMQCGYKAVKKAEKKAADEMSMISRNAKVINLLKYGSLLTDKPLIDKRLSMYKVVDDETKRAKERADQIVNKVLLDENIHGIFLGNPGAGKSHLGMSICWSIIERSNYKKTSLYVSYPYLLDQLKFAMNDEAARKSITKELMDQIQEADFVVIDDLGAELGIFNQKTVSTPYNNEIITRITDARTSKSTIYTSNLNAGQLDQAYGERVVSRMANKSAGYGFTFKTTSDKRKTGI